MGEGCRGESEPTTEDDDDELRGFRLCFGLNDAGTAEEVLPLWGDEMWPGVKLGGVGEEALGADVTGGCAEPFLEWEGAKLGGRSLPVALLFVICPRLLIFLEKPILPRYTDIMDQRDPAECEGAGHRADPFAVSVVAVLRHFADSVVEVTIGDADVLVRVRILDRSVVRVHHATGLGVGQDAIGMHQQPGFLIKASDVEFLSPRKAEDSAAALENESTGEVAA